MAVVTDLGRTEIIRDLSKPMALPMTRTLAMLTKDPAVDPMIMAFLYFKNTSRFL